MKKPIFSLKNTIIFPFFTHKRTDFALIRTRSASAIQNKYRLLKYRQKYRQNMEFSMVKSHFIVNNSFFFPFLLIRKTDNA